MDVQLWAKPRKWGTMFFGVCFVGQNKWLPQISAWERERVHLGLLGERTCRCFSQCYQEVPLSTWDLWPTKEISSAFSCKKCWASLLISFCERAVLVQLAFDTGAQWLKTCWGWGRWTLLSLGGTSELRTSLSGMCLGFAGPVQWGCVWEWLRAVPSSAAITGMGMIFRLLCQLLAGLLVLHQNLLRKPTGRLRTQGIALLYPLLYFRQYLELSWFGNVTLRKWDLFYYFCIPDAECFLCLIPSVYLTYHKCK